MSIRSKFTESDINKAFMVKAKRFEDAIISRLIFIGETFVANARANGTYKDQTGNLRSSICYVVTKNGVKKSPGQIPADSKDYIDELIQGHLQGYVLIVVAGMQYAAAVESRGKDVLTGSSKIAEKQLKAAIKNFKQRLNT
jgi:hypothetical protein